MPLSKKALDILGKNNKWKPLVETGRGDFSFTIDNVQEQAPDPSIERRVNSIWNQSLKRAENEGKILISNPIFGLQSIKRINNTYILNLYETTYKYVLALGKFQIPSHHEYFVGVRGVCFFKINKGRYILLGKRKREIR